MQTSAGADGVDLRSAKRSLLVLLNLRTAEPMGDHLEDYSNYFCDGENKNCFLSKNNNLI